MAQTQSTSHRENPSHTEAGPPEIRDQGELRQRHDGGYVRARSNGGGIHNGRSMSRFASTALRSMGQLCDVQVATARALFLSQFQAAAAFGLPDYSRMFAVADDRALRLLSSTIDNAASFSDQVEEIRIEVQSHVSRLLERQAIDLTERMQEGLEELQQQASEGLEQFKALSRRQAEEAARASDSIAEAARASLRDGSERLRETVREGMEQGRELTDQQAEAATEGSQRITESMRGGRRRSATEESGERRSE